MIDLRIEARRRADAVCIAEALDAPLGRAGRSWVVASVVETSSDLERVLTALQSCLDEHAIPIVTVVVDDDRYVMNAGEQPSATGQLRTKSTG